MITNQTSETSKNVVRRFVEDVWNKGILSAADEVLAPDYVEHSSAAEGGNHQKKLPGPEGIKMFVAMFRTAFPDIEFCIDEIISEGETVAVRLTGRGTHLGDFLGISPTGKQVTVKGAAIHHVVDGRIIDTYEFVDRMGLREQLFQ